MTKKSTKIIHNFCINSRKWPAVLLLVTFAYSLLGLNIRAGVGQIYPENDDFVYAPTHFFTELELEVVNSVHVGVGGRYIFFRKIRADFFEESVDNAYYDAYPVGFERRINGLGAYAIGTAQPSIGKNTKVAPFASMASGVHVVVPTVKLIYNCGDGDEMIETDEKPKTVPFIMISGGIEIILKKIGIFAQASYIKSARIKYEPFIPANDVEISPAGEVDPSGLQVFVGIAIH